MTGRRFKIVESVGSRIEDVNRYEDLAKHHPSAGREPNRDYETISGELEEVRHVGGRTLIKKDFVLLVDGSNRSIPVPSPLAGYAKTSRAYGTLKIYDAPTNGQLIGQILHLHPTFKVNDGDAITYGQHIGLQAGTDRAGAQSYAIHVHAELEEGDFRRYIADMVNGTLNPDDAKPDVAENGKSAAKGDWCYPYTPSAGHSLQHLTALSKAKAGFYPIGGNGLWHGGIHLDKGTSETFDQSRINCMTHGEVVAYRIDEEYPVSTYAGRPPFQIRAPFSTGFVLVRHRLQAKAPATADESKPKPPALTIYSLYMHLKCWKNYREDEKLERPAFWGSGVYTVNTRSSELNVRADAHSDASIVGKLSKGAQIRASGEGAFLKLEQVISGNNEPALTPGDDGSLPGYVSSSFLTAQSQPKTMGTVVLLDPPLPIKAGDLIGHVGKYQNQSDGSPQDLLHLEVFSCEDVPTFISESRTWAQHLPGEEKTLLKVHAGASKLIPHRDDIKAGNPPKLTDDGAEIGVGLILPQSLLDALPTEAKINIPASNTATGCSPETNWWRLDDLLADKDGQLINGWLAEQELITTRHSPWEWEGFDFLEDTDTPSAGLAYYLNAARRLSDNEKASYQGAIDQSDNGPVRSRLYDIIDTNRDGKMTSEEIQAALEKPWHAQSISQLVTRHESEWFWDASRWDELDELMGHSPDDPNQDWVEEKNRIKALSWWSDVAGSLKLDASGKAWHLQPIGLLATFSSPRTEEITVSFLEKILKKPGDWFTGRGGPRSFVTRFQENYPAIHKFDKEEFVKILNAALTRHGITTSYQKAHFLAQCYHESAHFETTIEFASGEGYNPGQHRDAIRRGNTEMGDGPKYKGKGLIQLTWKNNYAAYSRYRGINFIDSPDLIASDMYNAVDASCWFWRNIGGIYKKYNANGDINVLIEHEKDNVDLITLAVNGGYNGLAERKEIFAAIKREWNLA